MQKGANVFPKESGEGSLRIIGNKIRCDGSSCGLSGGDISIDDLQYAYVVVNSRNQACLFLFDHHQHSIPVHYTGFKHVYETLSAKLSFNDAVFFESIQKKEVLKKEIWRRIYEPTYSILNEDFNDYDQGVEIQSPERQFISWETTYEELEKIDSVAFERSLYGQQLLTFKYPVRIGTIQLTNLYCYFDRVRKDAPVSEYFVQCFNTSATDASYADLKQVLVRDLAMDPNRTGYERADQKNIYFNANGISISICYTYNSDWQFDGGYTSLSIKNLRDYPALLIDEQYESELVVSDFLIFYEKSHMPGDYKNNKKVKRRPQKITDQFQDKTVVWRDDLNHKIGFACGDFSQVYDQEEIKSLVIQNVLPAKGGGSGDLELVLEQGVNHYRILSGKCYYFDTYAQALKQLMQKELAFGDEYYDC
jgi:hypothetical protein